MYAMYSLFESLILKGIDPVRNAKKEPAHYDFIAWEREKIQMAIDRELLK